MKLFILSILTVYCPFVLSQTPTPTVKPDDAKIQTLKAQNAKAAQINEVITRYNDAAVRKDWPAAAEAAKQLTALDPNPDYYLALGNAQLNSGNYVDAIGTDNTLLQLIDYPSGLKTADAKTKALAGAALTSSGNAHLKLKNYTDATKNYELAAEIDPNPGLAYFNLCATRYNTGNMDAAITACSKSIAADPKRADAYFIKGSALYGNGKIDTNGKYVLPPGTLEALKQYLELAPDGAHIEDVKAMLDAAK